MAAKKILAEFKELAESWDVWQLVEHDEKKQELIIQRTDEDEMIIQISYPSNYPQGVSKMTSGMYLYDFSRETLSDALDNALEIWVSDDTGRQGSSQVYENAVDPGVGSVFPPQVLERAKKNVSLDVEDAALKGNAFWMYDESARGIRVRVKFPLSELDTLRCNALGVDRQRVIVISMMFDGSYITETSACPKVESIFTCLSRDFTQFYPESMNPHPGPLGWYLKDRMESALKKNAIVRRRVVAGLEEYDKTNRDKVLGLAEWSFCSDEENFYTNGNTNLLLGVYRYLEYRMFFCTVLCIVCDSPLPRAGMKMGVCDKELCRHAVDNYGIGVDVLSEILKHTDVTELLVYCTRAAASIGSTRDTFTPMCPIAMQSVNAHYSGPIHFYRGTYGDMSCKNFELIKQIIDKIPKFSTIKNQFQNCTTEQLRKHLNSIDPLIYPLLQWILSSNRAHLEPIAPRNHIQGMGQHQFHLMSSAPAKEQIFREKRDQAKKAKGGTGSFYAWHGSQCGNWHCILREGLKNYSNTSLMSTGAAHGAGIYTAKNMNVSLGYMGSPYGAWTNAERIKHNTGCTIIALCEVADVPSGYKHHSNDYVTVQDEDLICTRFLFVFPDGGGVGNNTADATKLKIPQELLDTYN